MTVKNKLTDYTQSVDVFVVNKVCSVFIQTDKPAYKPEDVVRFRVLVLDAETKPYRLNKLQFHITDSNANVVAESSTLSLGNPALGVFVGDYAISESPHLGEWSIHVRVDNGEETSRSFEVSEYVLPRFSANIISSPNVLLSDGKFKVTIFGEYTFGEFVYANAVVSAKVFESSSSKHQTAVKVKTATVSAKKTIEFDMIRELNIKSTSIVRVGVVLEEKLTGKKASDSMIIKVHEKSDHQVELRKSDARFKPGLPFKVSAIVRKFDGTIEENKEIEVHFNVTYFYSQPRRAERLSSKNLRLLSSTFSEEKPLKKGFADLVIDGYENVTKFEITASYKDSKASLNVYRSPSRSREYLKAQVVNERSATALTLLVQLKIIFQFQASGRRPTKSESVKHRNPG